VHCVFLPVAEHKLAAARSPPGPLLIGGLVGLRVFGDSAVPHDLCPGWRGPVPLRRRGADLDADERRLAR